ADVAAGVMVAGEPETAARRERAAGITIDAQTWRQLEDAAVQVGMQAEDWRRHAGLATVM
ncbi:MAG: hypothetical protein ABIQ60_01210, partial [Burkholderiaceae bacterium]